MNLSKPKVPSQPPPRPLPSQVPGAPAGAPPPEVKVDAPVETAAAPQGPTKLKKTKQQRKEALFKKKRARAVLSHKVQSLDMGLYPVDTDSR